MKIAWSLGVVCAVLMHAGFLLFGGILFPDPEESAGTVQSVDLLTEVDADESDKQDEQPQAEPEESDEEMESESEEPPDAAEILRSLEASPVDDSPALDAVSLSAIEAALSGSGGAGDFTDALSFESGGRIGGTGKVGAIEEKLEEAFSLAELDQKPRATFQASPVYPAEMRGKKFEGVVSVIFVVNADGKVENPRVERSNHAAFDSAATAAVKKWKFEPGVRAGQRVASKMRVTLRFPGS
jgi:TonB family protein